MTLVAVWRSGEDHLMAAADTRITRAPGNILTEHGPKILPVTIRGKRPGATGFFDHDAFQFDVGLAYAGATLPALSTHALANVLLGSLAGFNETPPLLGQVAQFIKGIAGEYMHDVGQLNGTQALFKAVVFGFCPTAQKFQAFEILPRLTPSSVACEVVEHTLDEIGSVVIIGSCPDLLRGRIQAEIDAEHARGDFHPVLDVDRPTRALKALIREAADPTIGGIVQQGWATRAGFQIAATAMPIETGPRSPRNFGLFILGFDIMDMQQIGDNFVSLMGR